MISRLNVLFTLLLFVSFLNCWEMKAQVGDPCADCVVLNAPQDLYLECSYYVEPASTDWIPDCFINKHVSVEEIEGDCPNNYYQFREYTFENICGESFAYSQYVEVVDTEPPIINTLGSYQYNCDEVIPGEFFSVAEECSEFEFSMTEEFYDGECAGAGSTIQSVYAIDVCGNESFAEIVIEVYDVTAPVFSGVPSNTTISGSEYSSLTLPDVSASDNCTEVSITSYPVVIEQVSEDELIAVYSWQATDECGNSSNAEWELTIINANELNTCVDPDATNYDPNVLYEDNSQCVYPDCSTCIVQSSPSNLSYSCDQIIPPPSFGWIPDCFGNISYGESILEGDCVASYTIIRNYTFTNACDEEFSYYQTVSVNDIQPPIITGNSSVNRSCDEVIPTMLVNISDNCSLPTVSISEMEVDADCEATYTIIRTYTAVDDCGNESSFTQVINIVDTTDPIFINVPQDLAIDGDDFEFEDNTNVTAYDSCSGSVPANYGGYEIQQTGPDELYITHTWNATDDCGNSNSVNWNITVYNAGAFIGCSDPEASNYSDSPNILIYDESSCIYDEDCSDCVINDVPTDEQINCDDDFPQTDVSWIPECFINPQVSETIVEGDCESSFSIIRVYSFENACGDSFVNTQIIDVYDISSPLFLGIPDDVTIDVSEYPDVVVPDAIAFDECSGLGSEQLLSSDVTILNENSIQITYVWEATDECGNTGTGNWILTVADAAGLIGCMDPNASNYNPEAIVSQNGQCFYENGCPGDIDGNLAVNTADLVSFLADIGCVSSGDPCVGDMNNDGATNSGDLVLLLSYYGEICNQ